MLLALARVRRNTGAMSEGVDQARPVAEAAESLASDAAIDAALGALRAGGNRITDARRAVIELLARLDDHPSAEQIGEAIQLRYPGVHRATVYRTLDTLTALGIASHVHVSGAATAYHLTPDAAARSHLHARCRVCGRIIDLPADLLDPVTQRLAEDEEFELDPSHLALSGTCWSCRAERSIASH